MSIRIEGVVPRNEEIDHGMLSLTLMSREGREGRR